MNTVAAQLILADTDSGSVIGSVIVVVLTLIFSLVLYFIPAFIATARDLPNQGSVWVINIFLGWTFIGWVVALAMSVVGNRPTTQFRPPNASGPPAPAKVATRATKKCPDCAETVLSDAHVCKYCGHHFAPSAPNTPQKRPHGKSTKVKCNHCQHVQMVPLSQPTFVCEKCGTKLKRRTG